MLPNDLEPTLRAARADAFAPGFADRVAARIAAERSRPPTQLSGALSRQTLRLVPAVLAASLVLGAVNWWHARAADAGAAPSLAGVAGLSTITAASALTVADATADAEELP